jgi:hypothetical protein
VLEGPAGVDAHVRRTRAHRTRDMEHAKRRVLRKWHDEREHKEEKKDRKHKGGKLTQSDVSSGSAAARVLLPASSLCVIRSRVRRASHFEEREAGKQTMEQRKDVKLTPGRYEY